MSFRQYQRSAPGAPKHTCPDIDDMISTLEKLRASNAQLRESAEYWESAADEIHAELTAELERASEDALKSNELYEIALSQLDDAHRRIHELENELSLVPATA